MDCRYYDEGRCRSCTLIKTPHLAQVENKQRRLEALVAEATPGKPESTVWLQPLMSEESGFRSKAKMVVGGTVGEPTVGILDPDDRGVDLRLCPLYGGDLARAFPILANFITAEHLVRVGDVHCRVAPLHGRFVGNHLSLVHSKHSHYRRLLNAGYTRKCSAPAIRSEHGR